MPGTHSEVYCEEWDVGGINTFLICTQVQLCEKGIGESNMSNKSYSSGYQSHKLEIKVSLRAMIRLQDPCLPRPAQARVAPAQGENGASPLRKIRERQKMGLRGSEQNG